MKNFKSLACNILQLICPILIFIFLSQAYLTLAGKTVQSGYAFISFQTESVMTIYSIATVITCVFAAILILLALVSVLRNFNIIQTARYDKLIRMLKLIVNIVLTVSLLAALICIAVKVSEVSILSVGWAVITNLAIGCVSLLAYIFSRLRLVK